MATDEQRAEWQHYIEHTLMGSCHHIECDDDHCHLLEDKEFCELLDSLIFLCEECGWWCEISEMAEEGNQNGICEQCVEDR